MGGCYASDYRYTSQVDQAEVNIKKSLTSFFGSGDRKNLISAYRQMLKEGSATGFIEKLHEHTKVKSAPKEFSEYELEAKLNIAMQPIKKGKLKPGKLPSPTEIAAIFDFQPTNNALFLKDEMIAQSIGTNSFYGTEDGEERLVIIHKGGQYFRKEKGNVQPYNFGVPFEEYILKRSELRVPTNLTEVAEAAMRLNADGKMKHVGSVEKEKVDFFVINTRSGREYGCTVSKAVRQGKEAEVQHQLELEYAGYTPGFPTLRLNNEEEVVGEISQLYRLLLVNYGMSPVQVNDDWAMQLQPTRERKFDFAGGKRETLSPKALEKVVKLATRRPLLEQGGFND